MATIQRLEKTLVWRREWELDDVDASHARVAEELEAGSVTMAGFSAKGMPIMYFFPARNALPAEKRSVATSVRTVLT